MKGGGVERGVKQAAHFVFGLHISDSAERPPSTWRLFIRRSYNNLRPAPMLTLVHTRFHVAPPRDYICEAINKNDLLDIIKQFRCNGARLRTHMKIALCSQLVHCRDSIFKQVLGGGGGRPMFTLRITVPRPTYKYIILVV